MNRITLLEEAFARQLEEEENAKRVERERMEHERLAQRKRLEMQRITELRRLEEQKERPRELREEAMNGVKYYDNSKTPVATPTSSLTKSNSVAHMFGDRIRSGSNSNVKRAESMKVNTTNKPIKKTPSFTTRRRAGSLRSKNAGMYNFSLVLTIFIIKK